MKVVHSKPPNYDLLASVMRIPAHATFCYGDTIYNPSGKDIGPDIEYHEFVHSTQQGSNPDIWWNRWISEPDFRLSQELEAYARQYAFARAHGVRGRMLDWALDSMATALSGDEYGCLLTFGEARTKIRRRGLNY